MKIIMIIVATLFATFSYGNEETKRSLTDDMSFSVTLERGTESELQYGYFYATKPITDKFSTTYGATWNLDNPGQQHYIDLSTQTLTLNYQLNDKWSVYALNDFDPHFKRTDTWVGTTYAW